MLVQLNRKKGSYLLMIFLMHIFLYFYSPVAECIEGV